MKKFLLLFICSAFLFSCNEDNGPSVCGVDNPVEDLAWIKASIEEFRSGGLSEYSYLNQAIYQGETVFFFGSCCPFCNWAFILRDCQGNEKKGIINLANLSGQKVIWQPANSVCEFS